MALPRLGSVGWLQVLPRLGIKPGTTVLPAVTGCPLCGGGRLYTFQDTLFGGEWHSCRDCDFAGDPVGLAAGVWKVDRPEAVARLGADAALADYLAAPVVAGVGAALRAAGQPPDLARATAVRIGLVAGDWATRVGRFVSVLPRPAVRAVCHGEEVPEPGRVHKRSWGDLLAIPFEDVPGRTMTVWATGRDGKAQYAASQNPTSARVHCHAAAVTWPVALAEVAESDLCAGPLSPPAGQYASSETQTSQNPTSARVHCHSRHSASLSAGWSGWSQNPTSARVHCHIR